MLDKMTANKLNKRLNLCRILKMPLTQEKICDMIIMLGQLYDCRLFLYQKQHKKFQICQDIHGRPRKKRKNWLIVFLTHFVHHGIIWTY